ncbi:MAG TPA: hypothetical protein ENJ82_14065 [Bacteroidetes bacterium]|nr:hypothetical protein [Bacteroidota bacterium]
MSAIIVRFQFSDFKGNEFVELLKQRYGGGLNYIAEGTILVDTLDTAEELYAYLSPMFTYDDKLFIGEVSNYFSMHNISRTKPALHKVAI